MNFKGDLQELLHQKGKALPMFESMPSEDGQWLSWAIYHERKFEAKDSQKIRSQNLVAAEILKYIRQAKAPGPTEQKEKPTTSYVTPFADLGKPLMLTSPPPKKERLVVLCHMMPQAI